ncbi:nickel/cobalt transporter [Marinomonas algicola]|uniref:nickel/cobalt transporter n=1 Tax=Marinomonas algicola TaxID=2773454 RepID=UPI00174C2361|nr:nickel/cobalt transporter [Marinomonas algicola]
MKYLLSATLLCLLFIVWFAFSDAAWYQSATHWVMTQQIQFHRSLVVSMRSLSDGGNVTLLLSCVGVSFLYGVFHAVGPGHGKAVISSYMLASNASIKQGIGLTAASSFAQGVTAIVCVLVLGYAFDLAGQATRVSRFFEMASFIMIGAMGLWMLLRVLRNKPACCDHHDHVVPQDQVVNRSHNHSHEHTHNHTVQSCSHSTHHFHENTLHTCSHHHSEDKEHHHTNQHNAVEGDKIQRYAWWSMMSAIGIRPCSGAILVLLFSLSAGIFHWGVLATLAMSVGTAITVSFLAIISVLFRQSVYAQGQSSVWRDRWMKGFGIVASALLILISVSMLVGYLNYSDRVL